jgi:3-methyl-2-oxobutanoate hydroxymethyltransferase
LPCLSQAKIYLKGQEMSNNLEKHEPGNWRKPITGNNLAALRRSGEKIAMLTCYDASFATLMDRCGVEILLVGDTLGMVCQGHTTTLNVSLEDIAYHTASVARGNQTSMVIADMPFGTYATPYDSFVNAAQLIRAGAHMVKLEGGAWLADTVRFLTERAIPVCVHLGLTPQSIHQLGGYKIQARTIESAAELESDALTLEAAGAAMVLLEAIPSSVGKSITDALSIPVIGIGAGPDCSGQVLVLHDLLDIFPGRKPRFVKNFMQGQSSVQGAISAFVHEVKAKTYPAPEHCF